MKLTEIIFEKLSVESQEMVLGGTTTLDPSHDPSNDVLVRPTAGCPPF